jgi:hypothetical protein
MCGRLGVLKRMVLMLDSMVTLFEESFYDNQPETPQIGGMDA